MLMTSELKSLFHDLVRKESYNKELSSTVSSFLKNADTKYKDTLNELGKESIDQAISYVAKKYGTDSADELSIKAFLYHYMDFKFHPIPDSLFIYCVIGDKDKMVEKLVENAYVYIICRLNNNALSKNTFKGCTILLQSQIYRSSVGYNVNAWFNVVIDKDIIYSLEAIKFNIREEIPKDITDNKLRLINCIIKNINKSINSETKFITSDNTEIDKLSNLGILHAKIDKIVNLEFVRDFLRLYKTIVSNHQEKDECVLKAMDNSYINIVMGINKIRVEYKFHEKIMVFTHID